MYEGWILAMQRLNSTYILSFASILGGGDRERIFWQNFFFHCAFTRYEAGLSVDEIWSDQNCPAKSKTAAAVAEEEITFDDSSVPDDTNPTTVTTTRAVSVSKLSTLFTQMPPHVEPDDFDEEDVTSTPPDFDMVEDVSDPEMDELEAEIARELEN
jgi:hypothetical protein